MRRKPLPIGIDDFRKLRDNGYYYANKSMLIKELIDKRGKVNLFTCPAGFGRTLNMTMLRYFLRTPGMMGKTGLTGSCSMACGAWRKADAISANVASIPS